MVQFYMIPANKNDLDALHTINRFIILNHPGFSFKIDDGSQETAILINKITFAARTPEEGETWQDFENNNEKPFVPDMMDLKNKVIIEYEEESKPRKGPKIIKRGHWEESKRDSMRDVYYKNAGFRALKIWESELKKIEKWHQKLNSFLTQK